MPNDRSGMDMRVVAAAVALAGSLGFLTPAVLAQTAGMPTGISGAPATTERNAAGLAVDKAANLADQGQLVEARSVLDKLVRSPQLRTLSEEDHDRALGLLKTVETKLRTSDPIEVSVQKAELSLREGDLRGAQRYAGAVMGRLGADEGARTRAKDVLDKVETRKEEIRPAIPGMIEQARQDFDAQRYGSAKSTILAVLQSGVDIDPDQAQTLEKYQLKIVDMEGAQGAPFDVADEASMGALQPGQVRRTKKPGEGEKPPAAEDQPPPEKPAEGGQPPIGMPEQPAPEAHKPPPVAPTAAPPAPAQDDLIKAAMRAEAMRIIAEADQAYTTHNYNAAQEKYAHVLSAFRQYLQPDEVTRVEKQLADARVAIESNAGGRDLAQNEIQGQEIRRQQANAQFNNEMEQAQAALSAGDVGKARGLAAQAQFTANTHRDDFNEAERAEFDKKVADLNRLIDAKAQEIATRTIQEQERQRALEQHKAETTRMAEKERKINESIDRIRALQKERKYKEALEVCDQVLFLDPNDPTALLLRDILRDIVVYEDFNEGRRDTEQRFSELTLLNERAMKPPKSLMEYPADWPQKSFQRGELSAYAETPENRRVLAKVGSTKIPVDMTDNRLEDVLTFIKTVSNVDMDVDWESLSQIGVEKETLITLKLSPTSASTVLDRVLAKAASDPYAKAGWTVNDGIVTVASDETLRKHKTLIIYNIQDLLFEIPNYPEVPEIDLNSVLQQSQGGQGTSPFRDNQRNQQQDRPTKEQKTRQIIDIIQANVDFEGWRDNGGETGSLQELNGSLIITNTPKNHREIVGLLNKLREIRNMQINVETKFLLVNQDWFEAIGFDLDVVLNANNNQVRAARGADPSIQPGDFFDFTGANGGQRGLQRTLAGQGPVAPGQLGPITNAQRRNQAIVNPDKGWSPIGIDQNSLGLLGALSEGDFANSILAVAPALGIAGQFLDDVQVDFLIQATQADKRTVQMTAPRLTFTNGQTANIFVVTQQAFVSDLQPVVGDSAVGFDPTVSVASEGVTLLVEGVISADRRYVTMNVDAGVARIDGFAEQGVTAVAGGQLVNSADTQSFIQLPTITVTRVRTTATVPDEGTVLLGGQRLITEVEVETGVPVLSKIPIINRFFTNRLESKEEQTLLILLKPTIMIQSEEEEKAFPGLLDSIRSGLGAR